MTKQYKKTSNDKETLTWIAKKQQHRLQGSRNMNTERMEESQQKLIARKTRSDNKLQGRTNTKQYCNHELTEHGATSLL